jgi:hypothetical protein
MEMEAGQYVVIYLDDDNFYTVATVYFDELDDAGHYASSIAESRYPQVLCVV